MLTVYKHIVSHFHFSTFGRIVSAPFSLLDCFLFVLIFILLCCALFFVTFGQNFTLNNRLYFYRCSVDSSVFYGHPFLNWKIQCEKKVLDTFCQCFYLFDNNIHNSHSLNTCFKKAAGGEGEREKIHRSFLMYKHIIFSAIFF